MDSEELDSQRRQERLRRRRQRERDARARETAEQREARLARRRERYRAQRRQESQHTCQAQMDANRAAQRLRREAETPEARQLPSPSYCQSKPSFVFSMLSSVLRVFTPSARGIQLSAHALLSLSQAYIRTSSCMHSGGAHGPSHVVLQETVYKQRLLQLAQVRPTMPTFTSY